MTQRVVVVVDMQNGVFATPRFDRAGCAVRINQLTAAADSTLFITHREGEMQPGTQAFELLPELHQPAGSFYVTKTACDSFWQTELVGAGLGYRITVAADAHTTANRTCVSAEQLIGQHNEVWAGLSLPGNVPLVLTTAEIVSGWTS